MSMWGGIAAGLQDNGGVGLSDPYSDTSNIGSSFSQLGVSLIGAAANVGESYAVSNATGGTLVSTGNPLAPTTVIPTPAQQTQMQQAGMITSGGKMLEYGIVALIAILLGIKLLK